MPNPVYLLSSARTDFKRNLFKESKDLRSIVVEAGLAALNASGLAPSEINAGILGNFAAGLFTRQLHLGALLTEIHPDLRGIPTLHTEAACASGGVAVLNAAQLIAGGIYDAVLVVGAEQQKTMPVSEGADVLGAAGDFKLEKPLYGSPLFPKLFGQVAQRYMARYPLTQRDLAHIAVKNYAHAKLNPEAQLRDRPPLTLDLASTLSEDNPLIADPLLLSDCSQITDGAAAVILISDRLARKLNRPANQPLVQLLGWGHSTDHLALDAKSVPDFPYAKKAADAAYKMASLTPKDLHGAEIHDCFSITEMVAYELLSLAKPGQAPALARSGATAHPAIRHLLTDTAPPFSLPVNTSGGLIADGHPVGATGVRQVVEAHRQLTQTAGQRQIPGAKRYLTFNMGGTITSSVVMIWGN